MTRIAIDRVCDKLTQQKRRFDNDLVDEKEYLQDPAWPRVLLPSQHLELLKQRGTYEEYQRIADAIQIAVELKRQGNLLGANGIYNEIALNAVKFTADFIWPWCKIMILAKNFNDLRFLVEYLYSYQSCYNRLCVREGYIDARAGSMPLGYECDPGWYLRELCSSNLASKTEVEQRFAQFGGSDYWTRYALSDSEFVCFRSNFGIPASR